MASTVRRLGPLAPEARRRGRPQDAYGALVRTIVGQQLSTRAARSIYARLSDLFGGRPPTPLGLEATDDGSLRACGLSATKISYLRDLARHVLRGELPLDAMHDLPDEEVVARLTAVKGLGRWSADMFLIFHLGRQDVLPVGDLGVRRAVERIYGLPELPAAGRLEEISLPWRPWRSLACLYLWESLDMANPVSGG